MATPIRVAIVAAYPTARAGLRAVIEEDPGVVLVSDAVGSGYHDEADVMVIDLEGLDGIDALGLDDGQPAVFLWEAPPGELPMEPARAHLLRDATSEELHAAIHAAVHGLTAFDPAILAASQTTANHGNGRTGATERLTEREYEVLRLLADGLTNKAIARRLGISDHTAKFHVGAILAKLGAESRTEAVTTAARSGLLPL